ncbi:RNA-binding protein 48-like isoform X2 [Myxocyprinus asiaticus]|uniref:RNA-binding protein 48-like isoform X2 n=2 Tax=Myxocyprinus asiaticus TaxID=70543 RepID=UPI002221F276|nr:RNA-binding protein 48-like isoform X2 [Myxocyprinus asiaticus]
MDSAVANPSVWVTHKVYKHHEQQNVAQTRLKYREGRRHKAVKVYTINLESRFLLVQGVPSIGVMTELVQLFALYGVIEEYRVLDEYPAEQFTEVYLFKFQKLTSARAAKRHTDEKSFFGGQLHICYAPEYETVEETRQKLQDRKRFVNRVSQKASILWPQKTWKIEQPGYSAKDPLTVFQKSKSYAKQHDQQQNESAELPRTDTPAASVPEFQKDYEKPTGENVNSDYLGFPLLSLPPREDLPHKHPLQLQRTTERTLPIEDNMGSLHHFSPTVPDTAKQITPCSSSSIFQGRDLSQKHKNLKPSVRFMPRTTHLESRKRKLEEQTLFLTEVDKNEPMIGPKLPELPKVDMEDNSLNLTANLIRQTMSKVASVPEVKPIQGKTTTAKPRRRI